MENKSQALHNLSHGHFSRMEQFEKPLLETKKTQSLIYLAEDKDSRYHCRFIISMKN